MTFADVVHALCREPFHMRPKDVGELTVYQARNLLTPREDDRNDFPGPQAAPPGKPPAMGGGGGVPLGLSQFLQRK